MNAIEQGTKFSELGLATRLWVGVKAGLLIAGVFCCASIVGFLIFGSQLFEHLHTNLLRWLAAYLGGGVAGGAVAGAMVPLVRSAFRAYLLGALCSMPFATAAIVAMSRTLDVGGILFVSALFGLTAGGAMGLIFYREENRSRGTGG